MRANRPIRLAAALAAALALTACGDTNRLEPTEHATPVAVASVPATVYPSPTKAVPTPTGTASATGAPSASPTGGGGGGGNEVKATATNKFEPATLTVKAGTEVTWTSEGFHSVTSGDPQAGADPAGPMKSTMPFTTYSVTFDKPGTYKYYCQPHASVDMVGEIVVT